jgi:hypothetical protein
VFVGLPMVKIEMNFTVIHLQKVVLFHLHFFLSHNLILKVHLPTYFYVDPIQIHLIQQ